MQNITNKLNCRAELWGMVKYIDTLKQHNVKEGKIKDLIFCNILPVASVQKKYSAVTEVVEYSHKFTVRTKSITNINVAMFFVYKKQRYEFQYWNPDYKNNQFIEVFTKLIVE
ncbi:hypothetical protein K2F43_06085 [Clostridium estertheticum]|uniref:hypothetical protein n=1 Tax=Clostridium estertheticum TaxID=238834 RepID=UPI001C6E006B|nr:hypothetical protein [Clostridium estertheticum]MBW9170775.1 hypothetical protein [Clostridium estertheticum]WLC74386.1 hypothetical protein KTC99_16670 [Clostridium estertheticum]